MKIFIKGLNSCTMRRHKLKQYETFFQENAYELVHSPEESDINFIWTCAFRADVKNNSLQEIQRYQTEYSGETVVAGCLPDIVPEELAHLFSGKIVNWKEDTLKMNTYFGQECVPLSDLPGHYAEEQRCKNTQQTRQEHPEIDVTFQDQFIKLVVSEGCLYQCNYCSERLMFPDYRSFPLADLVAACRQQVEQTGCKEVILVADSLGNYGHDTGHTLPELIQELIKIDDRLKIALNNLNPANFVQYYDEMCEFLNKNIFCHLNLPIQSASDKILKRMQRPYTKADIHKIFSFLNRISFKEFDTHILVGFPGETTTDIEETLHFVKDHHIKYALVSAYMESPQMPSALLDEKVPEDLIQERIHYVCEQFKQAGILYNADCSQRFAAMNATVAACR